MNFDRILAEYPNGPWIAAAIVAAILILAILRRRPWRGARTRYPILLAHGLLGFESIGIGPLKQDYFRGVSDHLEGCGNQVIKARVPGTASIEKRAEHLAAAIRDAPGRRVNVIAHSMGGLDARYAISKLGLRKKVASLTTIGTPHRGTPVADLGTLGLGVILGKLGLGAFADLTTASMEAFNSDVKNARGVRYGSVIATAKPENLNPVLRPTYGLLKRRCGANDGMVPRASQRWGRVLMRVNADHWGQIGWTPGTETTRLYERLARKLRARGL